VSPTPDAGEPVIEGNSDHEPGNGNPRPLERETIRDLIAGDPCGRAPGTAACWAILATPPTSRCFSGQRTA